MGFGHFRNVFSVSRPTKAGLLSSCFCRFRFRIDTHPFVSRFAIALDRIGNHIINPYAGIRFQRKILPPTNLCRGSNARGRSQRISITTSDVSRKKFSRSAAAASVRVAVLLSRIYPYSSIVCLNLFVAFQIAYVIPITRHLICLHWCLG